MKNIFAFKNTEERALDKKVKVMTNEQSFDLIGDLNDFLHLVD